MNDVAQDNEHYKSSREAGSQLELLEYKYRFLANDFPLEVVRWVL